MRIGAFLNSQMAQNRLVMGTDFSSAAYSHASKKTAASSLPRKPKVLKNEPKAVDEETNARSKASSRTSHRYADSNQ